MVLQCSIINFIHMYATLRRLLGSNTQVGSERFIHLINKCVKRFFRKHPSSCKAQSAHEESMICFSFLSTSPCICHIPLKFFKYFQRSEHKFNRSTVRTHISLLTRCPLQNSRLTKLSFIKFTPSPNIQLDICVLAWSLHP